MRDLIRVYEDAVPQALCDEVVGRFLADERRYPGKTGTPEIGAVDAPEIKHCTDLFISSLEDWGKIDETLNQFWHRVVATYIGEVPSCRLFYGEVGSTGNQIQHYSVGAGHYVEHIDANSRLSCVRQISGVLYLSDVTEGGETTFPYQGRIVAPRRGSICLFPSGFTHPHEAKVPQSADKFVVVTWIGFTGRTTT